MLPVIPTQRRIIRLSIEYNPDKLPIPESWDWDVLLGQHDVLAVNVLPPEAPSIADAVNPELTAKELASIIWSEGSAISPERFDYPIQHVLVLPYDLGLRLSGQDPNRDHFHFEFFPGLIPPRCEVWSKRAWMMSTTRQYRIGRARRESDPVAQMYDRFNQLKTELQIHLKKVSSGIKLTELGNFAEMLIKAETLDNLHEVLQIPSSLMQHIKEVRALYQAAVNAEKANENGPANTQDSNPAA